MTAALPLARVHRRRRAHPRPRRDRRDADRAACRRAVRCASRSSSTTSAATIVCARGSRCPIPATTSSKAECAFAVVDPRPGRGGRADRGRPSDVPLATVRRSRAASRSRTRASSSTSSSTSATAVRGALALTLLRATGFLSRGPMATRALPAGPIIEMEGSQVLGRQHLAYAVALGEVDPLRARRRRLPADAGRGRCRAAETGRDVGDMLRVSGAEVSSVRRVGTALEVRVFNPTAQRGAGRHRPSHRVARRPARAHRGRGRGHRSRSARGASPRSGCADLREQRLTVEALGCSTRASSDGTRIVTGVARTPTSSAGRAPCHRTANETSPRTCRDPVRSDVRACDHSGEARSARQSFAGLIDRGRASDERSPRGRRRHPRRSGSRPRSSRSRTRSMSAAARGSPIAVEHDPGLDQGRALDSRGLLPIARSGNQLRAAGRSSAEGRSIDSLARRHRAPRPGGARSRDRSCTPSNSCARANAKPPGSVPGASIRSPRSATSAPPGRDLRGGRQTVRANRPVPLVRGRRRGAPRGAASGNTAASAGGPSVPSGRGTAVAPARATAASGRRLESRTRSPTGSDESFSISIAATTPPSTAPNTL